MKSKTLQRRCIMRKVNIQTMLCIATVTIAWSPGVSFFILSWKAWVYYSAKSTI